MVHVVIPQLEYMVHKLITIDLSTANVALFEEYERQAIALLGHYAGELEVALRSSDGLTETHVLHFPDEASFEKFLADPVRKRLQQAWAATGATTNVSDVRRVRYT